MKPVLRHSYMCLLWILFFSGHVVAQQDSLKAPQTQDSLRTNPGEVASVAGSDTSAVPAGSTTQDAQRTSDPAGQLREKTDIVESAPKIVEIISFGKVFWSLVTLLAAYVFSRILNMLLENLAERSSTYRLVVKRLIPVMRILLWITALYIVIQGIIAPPIESLLALTASVGIAVGFASQDILKNIFGGFMILLDRPFQVGDKIDALGYYGEVLQIGLRSVRIVTPDDSVVTIPNGELMNRAVSNANSGAIDCQVVAEIFLPATIDIRAVKEIAYKAAATSRYIYLNKPIAIIAKNEIHQKNYVVKLRVKAYVLDIRYEFPFMSEMTELILAKVNQKGLLPEG